MMLFVVMIVHDDLKGSFIFYNSLSSQIKDIEKEQVNDNESDTQKDKTKEVKEKDKDKAAAVSMSQYRACLR